MNKKKFSKDLAYVLLSNIIVLLSGVVSGFVVPKALGVEEYGIYKIFSLYMTYGALFHFGFVDGILLKFAGIEYEELDKNVFRTYTKFFILFELIIAIVIFIISITIVPPIYCLIFVLVAVDIAALNITAYYQYVSQATMRFWELSKRKVLLAILKIIVIFLLLIFSYSGVIENIRAIYYILGIVAIDTCLTIWYAWTYREITWGKSECIGSCKRDIQLFFKDGIILTVSFQAAAIIFTLDRQFVSVLFNTSIYGVYSFAYNLISIVTGIVSAIALVLFPRLRQMKENEAMNYFSYGMNAILIVSFAALLGFQPLEMIIHKLLPDYNNAIIYLRIIFPGLSLSCGISVIMYTFYKVLNAHKVYFKYCCIVLLIAIALNYGAFQLFHTPESISAASIITLIIWYLLCLQYFVKNYNVEWKRNVIYIICLMSLFYLLTYTSHLFIAWFAYLVVFTVLTYALYKKMIDEFIKRLKKK